MGHGPELKSEVFSFVTLYINYNTSIHTKRAPDTRGRFSHLMGAGPNREWVYGFTGARRRGTGPCWALSQPACSMSMYY